MELTGDRGGKASALAGSLRGRNRVARTLIDWLDVATRIPRVQLRPVEFNGGPGATVLDGSERVIGVVVLDIGRGQIQGVSSIANPDELAHLGPAGDLASLLRTKR